ncbi:MAG: heme exporter protein CcmB [Actinobacteria bacterium]|nr:heme exporter protein CcmB [Actinomycetota bacterium]
MTASTVTLEASSSATQRRPRRTRQAWMVARRDLAAGVGGRRAAVAVLPLVAAVLLLAGLGFGAHPVVVEATAAPLVWLVVLLSAVPLARTVAADDAADDCWDLLRAVVDPTALLAGKLAAQWLLLTAAWAVASLLTAVSQGVTWPLSSVAGGILGALGLAAVTTMLGALLLSDQGHGSSLLAVLVLPVGLPALLAGGQLAVSGVSPTPWLAVLVAYDTVLLAVAWAVFPVMVEGS